MKSEYVLMHGSSGDIKISNSELFNITWDKSVIEEVNLLNYREDYSTRIVYALREEGLKKLCAKMQATPESYYFVESITEDLELLQTAEERELKHDELEADLAPSAELEVADYFDDDEVDNSEVEAEYLDICNLKDWTLKYDNGLTLSWKDLRRAVSYENGLKINEEVYAELAKEVGESYDTVGARRSVETPNGEAWTSGGTYGWSVDEEKEEKFLRKNIAKRKGGERTPKFEAKAWSGEYDNDVGDTYVVIDISEQHVWYYEDGKVVKDSDCVTGTRGVHDTPLGTYAVMEVMPQGKVLRGDGYASPVKKWIRLTNSGIGLHDASWRSSFGGGIYLRSGSHGCINLPYDFANFLCERLETGMPVLIVA